MSANPTEMPEAAPSASEESDTEASAAEGNDPDPFPGTETKTAYVAIDGISPDVFDAKDKEQLIIHLQNLLLADLGYPIEGVRLVESPRYAVEFTDDPEINEE
jgi:hypothetical protein